MYTTLHPSLLSPSSYFLRDNAKVWEFTATARYVDDGKSVRKVLTKREESLQENVGKYKSDLGNGARISVK